MPTCMQHERNACSAEGIIQCVERTNEVLRFAKEEDVEDIHNLYAWYVKHCTATFAYEAPTKEEMRRQWRQLHAAYPYLVYTRQTQVLAYAYAHPYQSKEAYQWDVELSIYVHPVHTHQGIGRRLLDALLKILCVQGFHHAYSCITIPNAASVTLHQQAGFQQVGTFTSAGYKLGQWLDVVWMEKELLACDGKPNALLKVAEYQAYVSKNVKKKGE